VHLPGGGGEGGFLLLFLYNCIIFSYYCLFRKSLGTKLGNWEEMMNERKDAFEGRGRTGRCAIGMKGCEAKERTAIERV
jgi:hypothetical protein